MLPADLAAAARANMAANRSLSSLSGPPPATPPKLHTVDPRPAGVLLGYYRAAERRFHVAWQVLAAVNFIESKFGRVTSNSSAGAQGPMQFIPSTWKAYGLGGNVHDPRDAIMGAANYLSASGAPGDYARRAVPLQPERRLRPGGAAVRPSDDAESARVLRVLQLAGLRRVRSGARRLTGPGL